MDVNDRVYGAEVINEPVLIELISSKAVQRLKGISQQGVPVKYTTQPYFTRYDHSLGVLILLRRLGANLQEQIAGLLHDVSHPTFSHLIDWVVGDPKKQNHQDDNYVGVLKNSDIPEILSRHGYKADDFLELVNYGLLESEAPNLCADRIDYCLRDLAAYGGKVISDRILEHLKVHDGKIIFDSIQAANAFSYEYMYLQRHSWGSDKHVAEFTLFAEILSKGLSESIINEKDFFSVDEEVVGKLENSENSEILEKLNFLKKGFRINYNDGGILLKCKFRFIDPEVLGGEGIKKLSDISSSYKEALNLQRMYFNVEKRVEVIAK